MTMYQSLHADGTSVSTFLCTRKLGAEEVSVSQIAVQVHRSLMNLLKYSFKVLNDDFLMSETQQLIILTC